MIFVTKLDGKEMLLNEMLIETITETPDTVITLSNGHTFIVRESMKEIQTKIIEYNRSQRRHILRRRQENSEEPLK